MKLSIIIPVFNEKQTILEILNKIELVDLSVFPCDKEIIIVDDFSTDGTRDILKPLENKYKIIYHEKNMGKGSAIRTGLKEVTGGIVIIQDADMEYDPNDYAKLIKPIIEGTAKVVYGSRYLVSNKMSSLSFYLGGRYLSILTNLLYGTNITDEPTCYKVFRTDVIKNIPLVCTRFEFCPEVTAKVAKQGIAIQEIPISYHPRQKSEGKKINWRDGITASWVLIKNKFI